MAKPVRRSLRDRVIIWSSVLFTLCVLFVSFTPAANIAGARLVVGEDLKRSDLIVVLGGGAYRNGRLGHGTEERFIRGLTLYRQGYAPKVFFSGGAILKPSAKILKTVFGAKAVPVSELTEAELMEEAAVGLGFPAEAIDLDTVSTNTYENLKETKKFMEVRGFKTCLIVTSPTHMTRASLVARRLGIDFRPAPVMDYTAYRTSAVERIALFREVAWEYLALALYRTYGYI